MEPDNTTEKERAFSIEPLTVADIKGAMSVMEQNEQVFTREDLEKAERDIRKSLGGYERVLRYFVMRDGLDKIVGVIGYGEEEAQTDVYYLGWFAVDSMLQKRGLGKTLLRMAEGEIIKENQARLLIIRAWDQGEQDPVRKFYESCGFQIVSTFPNYWGNDENMVIFSKHLK